jgi:hypothetical protein
LFQVNVSSEQIKIVEEPILSQLPNNLGGLGIGGVNSGTRRYQQASENNKLKLSVRPAPFAGPEHLNILNRKCFDHTSSEYVYASEKSSRTEIEAF